VISAWRHAKGRYESREAVVTTALRDVVTKVPENRDQTGGGGGGREGRDFYRQKHRCSSGQWSNVGAGMRRFSLLSLSSLVSRVISQGDTTTRFL
jgi:hypothetical protein